MFYLLAVLFVWGVILYGINQSLDSGILGRIADWSVDWVFGPIIDFLFRAGPEAPHRD